MKIACRHVFVLAVLSVSVLHASDTLAQTAPPRERPSPQTAPRDRAPATTTGNPDHAAMAAGWTALAQGRVDEAVKAADGVLARQAMHHTALGLKIEALSSAQPIRALDTYEAWLVRSRAEDMFLLDPIARGTLEQIAAGDDPALQRLALQRLARAGDTRAAERLKALGREAADAGRGNASTPATPARDVQLALEGDEQAATRLIEPKVAALVPPQTLARALPSAGAGAVPMLRTLLKHPAAPVRMEAAMSLGKLGATDAIPELKAMMADPEVRSYAAVALTRLGDEQGEPVVQEMLQSSVLDMRVLAAQAYEGKGPGPWVQALMPALDDPNGLTRVRAAELLAPVAPEAARPVLLEAAKDPNPVVRADVMRVMDKTDILAPAQTSDAATAGNSNTAMDLATIRRLLRDPDASTRLHAAASLLTLLRPAR